MNYQNSKRFQISLFVVLGLTFAIFTQYSNAAKQDRCLGLVLKGGANRGAYEAGVLDSFVKYLPPEEVQYDVVSGVSVGALNSAFISLYPKGEEKKMVADLIEMAIKMKQENFYQSWWGGIISGLIFKPGLYDNSPLLNYLKEQFGGRPFVRKLSFNAVDANTGVLINFNETIQGEDFYKALIGSTSMPFIFPSMHFYNQTLIDGGSAWNLDLASAIRRCRELVDDDSKIVLDIIDVGTNSTLPKLEKKSRSTISNFMRARAIKNHHSNFDDIVEVMRANPSVKIRYDVIPQQDLESVWSILSLESKLISSMIEKGKEDGKRCIESLNGAQIEKD